MIGRPFWAAWNLESYANKPALKQAAGRKSRNHMKTKRDLAGTSRSRIDQQPKGPFNGFEDRAYHRARLAPKQIVSTLLVKNEEEDRHRQTGEGIKQS